MDSYELLTKPGDTELRPVVPGKPGESELYRLLLEHDPEDRMPQKADPLPEAEIALIARWITEGSAFDGSSPRQPLVEMVRDAMLRPAPAKYARAVPITALSFSPDGGRLAISGYYEVTVWDATGGHLLARIGRLPERITSISWHPRMPMLAVAGGSPMQWGTVALVDPSNLAPPRYLCDLPENVLSVSFSPDGHRLAAGCGDRTLRLYDPVSARERKVLKIHADWVQSVAFSDDSQRLLTTSRDRTARILDPGNGEVLASYTAHDTPLLHGAFLPGDTRAWTVARGGVIQRWETANGERKGESKGTEFLMLVPLKSEKAMLAVAADQKVRRFENEKVTSIWEAIDAFPQAAALSPDGKTLAIGGADGSVTLLAASDGKVIRKFAAQP